jgi:CheY-like chemotaxis protein
MLYLYNFLIPVVGVDDYLVKTSFSEKELLARVKTHFELGQLRRNLRQQVEQKTEELLRVNTALYEFIDMICHEIRNPLHGIIGNLELLLERVLPIKKEISFTTDDLVATQEYINNIKECTNQQERLMEEVVMLTKLYSNKFETVCQDYNPCLLLNETIEQLLDDLTRQQIEVKIDTPQFDANLSFDTVNYRRILHTLLVYMMNCSQQGDIIHVSLLFSSLNDEEFKITTKLTSAAFNLDQNKLTSLLSLHQHSFSHKSIGGRYTNTGFSLPISNKLVEIMGGGSIAILDDKEKGFTFDIRSYAPTASDLIGERNDEIAVKLKTPKRCALVAEDNYINQVLCKRLLKKIGYECVIANDGKEALEKYRPDCYDFVLMDIAMPYYNGIEVTQKIRQLERDLCVDNPIAIIGLSAYAQSEKVNEALTLGMNYFISKPATLRKISEVIDKCK